MKGLEDKGWAMRKSSHLEHGSLQVENEDLGLGTRLLQGAAYAVDVPMWCITLYAQKGNCVSVKHKEGNLATIAKIYARLPNWSAMTWLHCKQMPFEHSYHISNTCAEAKHGLHGLCVVVPLQGRDF